MQTSVRPSEDELIARYFAPLAGEGGLALKDDAARLSPKPGYDLVLTADAIVAGVHFFADDPPASIGRKALGVNVSDLAAKGSAPVGFLLTLALPNNWTEDWLADFCEGLGAAAQEWGCPLLGGDTVRANGPLLIGVSALGDVPAGAMVTRTSARPGDRICVTGTIGDAALGLDLRQGEPPWAAALSSEERDRLLDRYRHPRPRLALAPMLRRFASAAMDVSDGLAGDLAKMMRASGTSAFVQAKCVPLSPEARAAIAIEPQLFDRVVTGGDDYEILCTVRAGDLEAFLAAAAGAGVAAAAIGTVVEGSDPPLFRDDAGERRYEKGSFSHF